MDAAPAGIMVVCTFRVGSVIEWPVPAGVARLRIEEEAEDLLPGDAELGRIPLNGERWRAVVALDSCMSETMQVRDWCKGESKPDSENGPSSSSEESGLDGLRAGRSKTCLETRQGVRGAWPRRGRQDRQAAGFLSAAARSEAKGPRSCAWSKLEPLTES